MATEASTKVTTGKCRLSYVHLFAPYAPNDKQTPKYSTVLLVPKTDKITMKRLRAAQQQALLEGKDKKFGGSIPKNWKDTIHDGDEEADLERNPEYAGHWYLSVSNPTKPGVVDRNVQPILDPTEVYSGCYARASLGAFAFNTQGNKGVSFGLNNIQKMGDGDSLTGATRADQDFEALDDEDDEDGEDLL